MNRLYSAVRSITSTEEPVAPVRSRPATRALVVLATVLTTVVVWTIAIPVLGLDVTVPEGMGSTARTDLAVGPVVFMAAASALAGWALLAVLERFTRRARTVWTIVALAVLVLSMPYLPGFTATERTVLILLHLAVGAVLIPGLRRTAAQR